VSQGRSLRFVSGTLELHGVSEVHRAARPYQDEALAAWKRPGGRGVVVLPTGAGKTHVAVTAIDDRRRSDARGRAHARPRAAVVGLLRASFGVDVGVVGGGEHDVLPS
jgi:hypothetical protein